MSPDRPDHAPAPGAAAMVDRIGHVLGSGTRDERLRRAWSLRQLAVRAGVSPSRAHTVEAGKRASLEMYARLAHALGLRIEVHLTDGRRGTQTSRDHDAVHAAMGELEAKRLRALGLSVSIDEPYQHYQFAGRADVLAWSVERRALLHIENRTRFPDLQQAAGSYNAKRAYLAPVIADRIGLRGGFRSVTHVIAGLWSSEVIHVVRLRSATFRSLCPDPIDPFEAWWVGQPPAAPASNGDASCFVLLDPTAVGRQRPWVDLDATLAGVRPRFRGYADAVARLSGHV